MKFCGNSFSSRRRQGLTLIEMTVVILLLLTLTGAFFASAGSIGDWQKAKEASSILREAEVAQREFLANNPQKDVTTLTATDRADIISYLPGGQTAFPDVFGLEGETLTININVSPPILEDSGGTRYDKSATNDDSLWDVGQ